MMLWEMELRWKRPIRNLVPPAVGSSFPRFALVEGVQVRIWHEVTGYTPKTRFIQYRRLQADNAAPQQRISLVRWHREGWAS